MACCNSVRSTNRRRRAAWSSCGVKASPARPPSTPSATWWHRATCRASPPSAPRPDTHLASDCRICDNHRFPVTESLMNKLALYLRLIRMDKPIGTVLLLWPTLIAMWLASGGVPDCHLLLIFIFSTFLMRSAGCAINDYADQDIDKFVKRTAQRPITSGRVSGKEAIAIAVVLTLIAFCLILPLNALTKQMSVAAVILA